METMPTDSSALSLLRLATAPLHTRLERGLRIVQPGAGHDEFRAYLIALWGWHCSFEDRLWSYDWPAPLEVTQRRAKLRALAQDLESLGFDEEARDALPRCDYAPALDGVAERYGVAYVVEGAQLGTRVLGKSLAPALAPWSPAWLEGYGANAGLSWKTFIACLERALETPDARAQAAAAAVGAFESLNVWFELCGSRECTCASYPTTPDQT